MTARRRAWIAALLGAALLAPAGAAFAGKREPYPAARLWYRVSVEFKGPRVFTDRVSGLPHDFDTRWKLASEHAIRLTLTGWPCSRMS